MFGAVSPDTSSPRQRNVKSRSFGTLDKTMVDEKLEYTLDNAKSAEAKGGVNLRLAPCRQTPRGRDNKKLKYQDSWTLRQDHG